MWVIIVSREPLGDGSRSLHFIILLSCAIAQRMHGVCTCDSLLGSDVAPTSTRHKDDIKSSTIFNYFHCRHGYVKLSSTKPSIVLLHLSFRLAHEYLSRSCSICGTSSGSSIIIKSSTQDAIKDSLLSLTVK
jgi:hypothetical protein